MDGFIYMDFAAAERRVATRLVMSGAVCPADVVMRGLYLRAEGLYAPSQRSTFFEILALDSVYHSRLGMN